jgi:murein DD-endopeptidase MepM/ murein hydrolase activator NlpD
MVVRIATLAALALFAASPETATGNQKAEAKTATLEVGPGTVVRWSAPGAKRCGMAKRSWAAVQETCYYPIDVQQKPGVLRVSRHGAGAASYARITVLPAETVNEAITLGDIPQANPSPLDLKRNAREQALVARLWTKREGPAQFTLPLAPPVRGLLEGKGFGSTWVFNTTPPSSELHSGADYAVPASTPVSAAADGTVVLADDLFFAGNAVFIDHGDGLVTMYFHLAKLELRTGQIVKRGDTIGAVGSTGRVTGPHLHMGARWHGSRIDPALLSADPAKLPAITAP